MLEFLILKPSVFGLDISDLSIKIAQFEKKRGSLNLVSFGEAQIKPGIVREGEIRNENSLVQAIKEVLAEAQGKKIKTKYAIVSLPEEKAFLQVIQMPRLAKEDLKSAVIYEAENYIPLAIEDVYLDSQVISPIENNLDHYDVLIAAVPKKIVDSYVSCLRKADLKPLVLEIESLAIARALVKNEASNFPLLLIDFGATRTSFIVFAGRSVRFTSSIPVSSQKFTEAISRVLKIDLKRAEKLKLKYGLETNGTKEGGEVFDALIPALTDLTEQIKKHLDYYHTHAFHEHLPKNARGFEKILLCGNGANLKGLTDFLSRELNLEVQLANPWVNILVQSKIKKIGLNLEESLGYTTALGLALRGLKGNLT